MTGLGRVEPMDEERAAMRVSLADDAPRAEIHAGYKRTEVGVIPEDWDVVLSVA